MMPHDGAFAGQSHHRRLRVSGTLVSGSNSVGAAAAEAVYSTGSGNNLAAVQSSPRYELLTAGAQRNAMPVDDQRVASLHNHHVFVVIVDVRTRQCCLIAGPKCHLAPVRPVEDLALYSWCCLGCTGNPVCGMLHELGKLVHGC